MFFLEQGTAIFGSPGRVPTATAIQDSSWERTLTKPHCNKLQRDFDSSKITSNHQCPICLQQKTSALGH